MNDTRFQDAYERGELLEANGTLCRQAVTDIWGRPDALIEEMQEQREPLPWPAIPLRRDAYNAVTQFGLDQETVDALQGWIWHRTPYQSEPRWLSPQFVGGECKPLYHRARACWPESADNPVFWLPYVANILQRRREGPPHVPFVSKRAWESWLRRWPEIEAYAKERKSDIDLDLARQAIKASEFLG